MKYSLLVLMMIAGLCMVPNSSLANNAEGEPYLAKTFTSASGATMPYRIHLPSKFSKSKKYPLVLFFHGSGERGTKNQKVMKWGLKPIHKYLTDRGIEAIVIGPQCAPRKQWVDTPWSLPKHTMPKKPSEYMQMAMELLSQTIKKYPVDKSRIYVTGLSMGGFGAWDIMQRQPKLFAAGMPICGGGDTAQTKRLKSIPIRAYHGSADTTVIPQRSRDMVDAINAAGGKSEYIEMPKGHGVWLFVYIDFANLDWLFSHRKR